MNMNTSGELRTLINTKTIEFFNYNRFSDIKKINNGGYGEVYSAIYRPETEKMSEKMSEEMHEEIHVALKKLFTELDFDKKASEEFVKEVKHLHKVDHHSYINRLLGITQDIRKAEKSTSNFSGSSIIIVNLSQEFIKLYIKDMVTNSDDSVNNINNWLENNSENSKKIFDFVINTDVLIEHRETILAYFYMKGFGTNKDYNECLYWCKKGCEKKDVYSYYEAAFCYRYSYKNYNEAFHYFNLAASGGVLKAKSELAMMHLHGMGCEENKTKAFYLFKEAGEQDKIACCLISDCYYDGIGIEINLIEALKYYKIFWEKWHYYNAKIRIPLIEEKLEIPIEQRCNLR
ncbi:24024_t:CDS:2 [Gigaspora rosea]|nr:24024_t:CDS:2 [Gigaspora rosea]